MPGAIYRNFDDGMPALRDTEVEFELGGELFHCVPEAPGGVLARLISSITYDDRGRQVIHLPNMQQFVEDVLLEERTVVTVPAQAATTYTDDDGVDHTKEETPEVVASEACDDLERWKALMSDKKRPIPISVLVDVVLWLQGQYTADRPTAPSRP